MEPINPYERENKDDQQPDKSEKQAQQSDKTSSTPPTNAATPAVPPPGNPYEQASATQPPPTNVATPAVPPPGNPYEQASATQPPAHAPVTLAVSSPQQAAPISSLKKPGGLEIIFALNIVDGVLNIIYGFLMIFAIITIPLSIYAFVVAGMAISHAVKLSKNPPDVTKPNKTLAIMQLINIISFNLISVGIGIASLLIYNRTEVSQYYEILASRSQ